VGGGTAPPRPPLSYGPASQLHCFELRTTEMEWISSLKKTWTPFHSNVILRWSKVENNYRRGLLSEPVFLLFTVYLCKEIFTYQNNILKTIVYQNNTTTTELFYFIATTTTPRQAQKKSVVNSARRRQPNLWLTLMWLTFFLFAFQTNWASQFTKYGKE
jgi:hypothetical protein